MKAVKAMQTKLLIDGAWVPASSGRSFATLNPATEDRLAEIAEAGRTDVDIAVASARQALTDAKWARMGGAERGRILNRMAALIRARFDEIVELESVDGGKPVSATRRQDIPAAIDCLEYYAGWADKLVGEVIPTRRGAFTYTTLSPVGVVAAIVPWNFPLMNAVWKIAPALACGCTVVLKPAELTPLSALWFGALALEAGLPPGVLNVLPGMGSDAGAALVAHAGVDKISFTGSPRVGREIMRAAADNVTRIGLELGGKSANVVFADADLDTAVRQATSGAFFNAGQVCSAGARVLVADEIYDEFVARLAERASGLRVGDPMDPSTSLGPVISDGQMDRILNYIEVGRAEGAVLVTGGTRIGNCGYFIAPTIFGEVEGSMRIAQEEIFGPVVSVLRFRDEEEAVGLANGTSYSLAAAVWSRDIDRVHRMAERLRAGTVWINTYGPTDTRLPWGGTGGDSGVGRDLGKAALENYTEQKTIWLQLQQRAS
jgi:aldehyde dehydrogenase (NAD+)